MSNATAKISNTTAKPEARAALLAAYQVDPTRSGASLAAEFGVSDSTAARWIHISENPRRGTTGPGPVTSSRLSVVADRVTPETPKPAPARVEAPKPDTSAYTARIADLNTQLKEAKKFNAFLLRQLMATMDENGQPI